MIRAMEGDRVRVKGVAETSPEYDVGVVIGILKTGEVMVEWERADEIYKEDPGTLELLERRP